jgi:hypothetical protein
MTARPSLHLLAMLGLFGCVRVTDAEYDDRLDADGDGVVSAAFGGADCDDADPSIFPGATERCDGVDEDCDGDANEGEDAASWFPDDDGDGYGDPTATAQVACDAPPDSVLDASDCDDSDPAVHPGATEVCNDGEAVDEDCDPSTRADPETWFIDDDGDDFGEDGSGVSACERPEDHVTVDGDCDDGDASVSPGAVEICNNTVDDDCDGDPGACTWAGERAAIEAGDARFSGDAGADLGLALATSDVDGDGETDVIASVAATGSAPGSVAFAPVSAFDGQTAWSGARTGRLDGEVGMELGAGLDAGPVFVGGDTSLLMGAPGAFGDTGASGAAFLVTAMGASTGEVGDADELHRFEGRADGDRLGAAVALLPDVDGDGVADLLLGAPRADVSVGGTVLSDAGAFFVVRTPPRGLDGTHLLRELVSDGDATQWQGTRTSSGSSTDHLSSGASLGAAVAHVGDLVGDGRTWAAAGAPDASYRPLGCFGTVAIVDAGQASGGAPRTLASEGSGGLLCHPSPDARFGQRLDGAVDFDGDGLDDLVVGAPGVPGGADDAGAAHVILGDAAAFDGDASTLAGFGGTRLMVTGSPGDQAGSAVALSPDLSGDGAPDLIVGVPGARAGLGAVWVFSGWTGATTLTAADADAVIVGDEATAALGGGLHAPGDLDGDDAGMADLLIGAPGRTSPGRAGGEVWLLLGLGL